MEMSQKDSRDMAKVVMAGMKIMYDEKTSQIFTRGIMRKDRPIAQRLATEAAGLMKMLMDKSGGKIPKQILIPAALALLVEMAKFTAEAGVDTPTPEDMNKAKDILVALLKKLFAGQAKPAQAPAAPAANPMAAPPAAGGLLTQGV